MILATLTSPDDEAATLVSSRGGNGAVGDTAAIYCKMQSSENGRRRTPAGVRVNAHFGYGHRISEAFPSSTCVPTRCSKQMWQTIGRWRQSNDTVGKLLTLSRSPQSRHRRLLKTLCDLPDDDPDIIIHAQATKESLFQTCCFPLFLYSLFPLLLSFFFLFRFRRSTQDKSAINCEMR